MGNRLFWVQLGLKFAGYVLVWGVANYAFWFSAHTVWNWFFPHTSYMEDEWADYAEEDYFSTARGR